MEEAMEAIKMFINGEWVAAASGKTRDLYNPATCEYVATVCEGGVEDARRAIEAAEEAAKVWRNTPPMARGALLCKAAAILESRREAIALQETRHNGRLLRTSMGDVASCASIFRHFAGLANMPSGLSFNDNPTITTMTLREPIGVCGLIIPWNSPISIASKCIAPALIAGNAIVIKPSSSTPLGAVEICKALEEAGFPKGVVNLVLGDGNTIVPHCGMIGSKPSQRHGFKAADTAIVLHLGSRHTLHSIGCINKSQTLKIVAAHRLYRYRSIAGTHNGIAHNFQLFEPARRERVGNLCFC